VINFLQQVFAIKKLRLGWLFFGSAGSLTYPANFTLIASMNPCPCGYFGDLVKECTCSMAMVKAYQKKISDPLMDRIDIHVEVPRVPFEKLSSQRTGESSAKVRERIEAARTIQRERFKGISLQTNADMGPAEIRKFCPIDETSANTQRVGFALCSKRRCSRCS
jgi:magnesium chelatase family protein